MGPLKYVFIDSCSTTKTEEMSGSIVKKQDAPRGSNTIKKAVPARAKLKSAGNIKTNYAGSGTASSKMQSGDEEQYSTFINADASSWLGCLV